MKGFYINKLVVIGQNKKSEVEFSLGLNVITGPSNTGKSFLFQCIDYMFGKKEIKDIDEISGYTDIFLEISTFENECYTLKRQILGDSIFVNKGKIIDWDDKSAEKRNLKHSSKDNNISSFLLNLMGIPPTIDILKNQSGKKQSLSFRSLSEWFIIDEKSMISDEDMLIGEFKNNTPKQSTLLYIIDKLIMDLKKKVESDEVLKARVSGKIEVLNLNLENNRKRQVEITNKIDTKKINLNGKKLNEYKVNLINLQNKINKSNEEITLLYKEYEEVNTSLNLKSQQLSKFEILKKQYSVDIERLMFIKENSEKLNKLKTYLCPLCGNPIKEELDEDVLSACNAETNTIRVNLQELNDISEEIEYEKVKLEEKVNTLLDKITISKSEVDKYYSEINPLKLYIDEYIEQKQLAIELQNLETTEKRLSEEIVEKKKDYGSAKADRIKLAETPVSMNRTRFKEFLEQLFKEVDSSITKVNLTQNLLDIEINGRDRKSNGKGYRAFYKSLYFYALLLFKLVDDNYTKLLILDSPLTSFKEGKGDTVNEDVSNNLQYNFMKKMSENSDIQIIIFENKEVSSNLLDRINLIRFTKNKNEGRYGFLE